MFWVILHVSCIVKMVKWKDFHKIDFKFHTGPTIWEEGLIYINSGEIKGKVNICEIWTLNVDGWNATMHIAWHADSFELKDFSNVKIASRLV